MADVCPRMEKRSLIRRSPSSRDGRRKLLSLTELGLTVLHETNRRARRLDQALLDGTGDSLATLLNKVAGQWETVATHDVLD